MLLEYFEMYEFGKFDDYPVGEFPYLLLMKPFEPFFLEEGGFTTSFDGLKNPFFLGSDTLKLLLFLSESDPFFGLLSLLTCEI